MSGETELEFLKSEVRRMERDAKFMDKAFFILLLAFSILLTVVLL